MAQTLALGGVKVIRRRRRGTAIVETPKGILVASGRGKVFLLPGGGAEKWESRRKAALRELKEETGLVGIDAKYLFSFQGKPHKDYRGGLYRDYHKVFLVKARGTPRPRHEIKHIDYYKKGSDIRLSGATKEILEKYYQL